MSARKITSAGSRRETGRAVLAGAMVYQEAEIAHAVRGGDIDTVRRWLEDDNNPNDLNDLKTANGNNVLFISLSDPSREDRSPMLRLLLAHGADVHGVGVYGLVALHLTKYPQEADVLLKAGAAVDARDRDGDTPLMFAASRDRYDVARYLLESGADISATTNGGHTVCVRCSQSSPGGRTTRLLEAVETAGSWRSYVNAPRVALVRLRTLCARGRARPPSARRAPILARLFAVAPPPSTPKHARLASRQLQRPIPNEIFWLVLSFWRTDRDEQA